MGEITSSDKASGDSISLRIATSTDVVAHFDLQVGEYLD